MPRRISRESAVPAYDLSAWQRYILTETWKARNFLDVHGMLFFVVPYSLKDTLVEFPPAPFSYGTTQCQKPILRHIDLFDGETYFLCENVSGSGDEENVDIDVSDITPKRPRSENPPKTARLRYAVGNRTSKGTRERFPVVQVSSSFAYIDDIDERPPIGARSPTDAIAKIVTDRGVQYIYPPGKSYDGTGDQVYFQASNDRGSFDIRTLRKGATTPGRVNSRRLIPLGEGKKTLRGKPGKYAKIVNAIARAFVRGGGKFNG